MGNSITHLEIQCQRFYSYRVSFIPVGIYFPPSPSCLCLCAMETFPGMFYFILLCLAVVNRRRPMVFPESWILWQGSMARSQNRHHSHILFHGGSGYSTPGTMFPIVTLDDHGVNPSYSRHCFQPLSNTKMHGSITRLSTTYTTTSTIATVLKDKMTNCR